MSRLEAFIRWVFNDSKWSYHQEANFQRWFHGKLHDEAR